MVTSLAMKLSKLGVTQFGSANQLPARISFLSRSKTRSQGQFTPPWRARGRFEVNGPGEKNVQRFPQMAGRSTNLGRSASVTLGISGCVEVIVQFRDPSRGGAVVVGQAPAVVL